MQVALQNRAAWPTIIGMYCRGIPMSISRIIEIKRIVRALGKWGRFVSLRKHYVKKRRRRWDSDPGNVRRRWLWAYGQVIREVQEDESWHPTVGDTCG